MNLPCDPYDKMQVLDALVDHAWSDKKDHKGAFRSMGIHTKEQLRDVIEKSIEGSDTRVFKTQPVKEKGQTLPREVYELPLCNAEGHKPVAILNPSRDRAGRLAGGTCYVPGKSGKPFEQVFEQEKDVHSGLKTGHSLQIIYGGRPALRRQEQHQQVSTEVKSDGPVQPVASVPEAASTSVVETSATPHSYYPSFFAREGRGFFAGRESDGVSKDRNASERDLGLDL